MSSYLFLEAALLLFIAVLTHGRIDWGFLVSWWFVGRGLLLFVAWFALDETALALGLWHFPAGGTLPFRLFGLPLEEYLLFWISTVICALLVNLFLLEGKE